MLLRALLLRQRQGRRCCYWRCCRCSTMQRARIPAAPAVYPSLVVFVSCATAVKTSSRLVYLHLYTTNRTQARLSVTHGRCCELQPPWRPVDAPERALPTTPGKRRAPQVVLDLLCRHRGLLSISLYYTFSMIMHDHNIPSCDTLTPNACRSSPLHARLSTERDRVSIELVKWQDWMMVAVQPSSTADCTNLSLGLRLNSPVGRTAGTSPFAPGRHGRDRSRPPSPAGATPPARQRPPETR